MSFSNWLVPADTVFCSSPVIPVIQIKEIEQAIPLATALFAGGVNALEITLRTPIALEAVRLLVQTFPEALIGVGTIVTPEHLEQAVEMGAKFAFSPGSTQDLLRAGLNSNIPFIPGVTSVSELMEGLALGYTHFKFFPAVTAGGIPMLRSFYGPFPQARFCATGGINESNFADFLALPNVTCVGGSWIVPDEAIKKNDWSLITELCFSTRQGIRGWG